MQLFVVGLSHRTAPVGVRERLAIDAGELEDRLRVVAALPGIREVAILSTCNRVEIYGAFSDADQALESLRAQMIGDLIAGGRRLAIGPGGADESADVLFSKHVYTRVRRDALHHLYRVSASLDSLVLGEPQILGQIKEAFDLAAKVGTAGPTLHAIFTSAFRAARRVRRDTGIAAQRVSVSSVAVDLARQVWGGFAGRRVLLIGAGKMSDLAARVLKRDGASLAVVNRTRARAEELASRLGAAVEDWDRLADALVRADIVISSTGAREPVLRRGLVVEAQRMRHGRPLVIIDIAVPRDVEPAVGKISDVILYDIDDLQEIVRENLKGRGREGDRAEAFVDEEIAKFLASSRARSAGPTIAALRARGSAIAKAEVERALAGLPDADDRTRRVVTAAIEATVAKLLHAPSVALKKEAAANPDDEGVNLVDAAHKLFELPVVQPVTAEGDEAEGPPAAVKKVSGS